MAWTEFNTGTEAVGATEWSLLNDSSTIATNTTKGTFQVDLDVADLVAGDILKLRLYEKTRSGDTQRLKETWTIVPFGSTGVLTPAFMLGNGWDFTLQAVVGTVTVHWSIRQL